MHTHLRQQHCAEEQLAEAGAEAAAGGGAILRQSGQRGVACLGTAAAWVEPTVQSSPSTALSASTGGCHCLSALANINCHAQATSYKDEQPADGPAG